MKLFATNAKMLTAASLLLLMIPFLLFTSALLQQLLNIPVPPDTWLEIVSVSWLRISTFAVTFILLPLTAVLLNVLSPNNLRNNVRHGGTNIPAGIRTTNTIIIIVAGLVAILFTVVMFAD